MKIISKLGDIQYRIRHDAPTKVWSDGVHWSRLEYSIVVHPNGFVTWWDDNGVVKEVGDIPEEVRVPV